MQLEDCSGRFQKKKINEAKEIASLDMGAKNHYSSINFLGEFIESVSYLFVALMYVISTLLFLVAGKASQIPKVTYYFSSIVE